MRAILSLALSIGSATAALNETVGLQFDNSQRDFLVNFIEGNGWKRNVLIFLQEAIQQFGGQAMASHDVIWQNATAYLACHNTEVHNIATMIFKNFSEWQNTIEFGELFSLCDKFCNETDKFDFGLARFLSIIGWSAGGLGAATVMLVIRFCYFLYDYCKRGDVSIPHEYPESNKIKKMAYILAALILCGGLGTVIGLDIAEQNNTMSMMELVNVSMGIGAGTVFLMALALQLKSIQGCPRIVDNASLERTSLLSVHNNQTSWWQSAKNSGHTAWRQVQRATTALPHLFRQHTSEIELQTTVVAPVSTSATYGTL